MHRQCVAAVSITTSFFHYLAVSALVLIFAVRVALAQDSSRESVLWQDDFESYRAIERTVYRSGGGHCADRA
jgi:hypothetical protein